MKKLYRSNTNKIVFGILGGLGEYFNIDPTILRIVFLLLCFLTAILPLAILYIVCYFIIPKKVDLI